MAQATSPATFSQRMRWNDRIKPLLIAVVLILVAAWAGTTLVAPRMAASQPHYMPAAFASLPTGAVMVTNPNGASDLLPVRIADTGPTRASGFAGVGEQAMGSTVLLYTLTRETTGRASYSV
ncbi:MAG: hypothetical protein WD336_02885 [Trueperaceae bacterium]